MPQEISSVILPPKIDEPADKELKQQELMPAGLSENERRIWQILSADEPTHIDILLEASSLSIGEVTTVLLELEMRELVRKLPGNSFARKI